MKIVNKFILLVMILSVVIVTGCPNPNTLIVEGDEYTLSFDANGGAGVVEPIRGVEGAVVPLTENSFIKAGFLFIGWALTKESVKAYDDKASYTMGTADLTLHALWTQKTHEISFHSNGGTGILSRFLSIS